MLLRVSRMQSEHTCVHWLARSCRETDLPASWTLSGTCVELLACRCGYFARLIRIGGTRKGLLVAGGWCLADSQSPSTEDPGDPPRRSHYSNLYPSASCLRSLMHLPSNAGTYRTGFVMTECLASRSANICYITQCYTEARDTHSEPRP